MPLFVNHTPVRQENELSHTFISYFDQVFSRHQEVSLAPSDTLAGAVYMLMNICFLGAPYGVYWLQNRRNEGVREHLRQTLTEIQRSPERVQITHNSDFMVALRSRTLRFSDLRLAPVRVLEVLSQPQVHEYLKLNEEMVESQKSRLRNEVREIRSRMPEDTPENRSAVRRLEDEISLLETHMEKIRRQGYRGTALNEVIDAVYVGSIRERWQALNVKFQAQLTAIAQQIRKLEAQGEHAEDFLSSATQLKSCLELAHGYYIQSIRTDYTRPEKLESAERFLREGHQAILEATDVLCGSLGYGWREFLWDVLNTIILLVTIGISYAVAGRFRIFTSNSQQIEGAGSETVQQAEKAVALYEKEVEKLHEDAPVINEILNICC